MPIYERGQFGSITSLRAGLWSIRWAPAERTTGTAETKPLTPQLPASDACAFGQSREFDPNHAGVHLAGGGEASEAAIGAGDHIVAADHAGKPADALGDRLGVLHNVR